MEEQFYRAVSAMRQAQREYFKTRSAIALQESKALERTVDRLLAERAGGQTTMSNQ